MNINIKNYKHIIWDWNGTLINDVDPCVDILNNLLTRRKMTPVTKKLYLEQFDFPVKDYYVRLGFDFSKESFDDISDEFVSQYYEKQLLCPLQPNALNILNTLKEKDIEQSILSAFHQDLLEHIVEHFTLTNFFEHIVGLSDYYAASKVENAKKLLTVLDVAPEKVLLIGDTNHDHEVAQAVNIDCLLIAAGHQSKQKLLKCTPNVLDSLTDIKSL
jgi:phosphoglycolate phosphatase